MGNVKAQNAAKKLGIQPELVYGSWNGYGRPLEGRMVTKIELNKIDKFLTQNTKETKKLTPEEKITKWINRLDKLTNCGIDTAKKIADEKIIYAFDNLANQVNASYSGWKIPAWRKQAERKYDRAMIDQSTLLDFIKDIDHAYAILSASHRHSNTNYELILDEAKELARSGQIDKEDIQDYARRNYAK